MKYSNRICSLLVAAAGVTATSVVGSASAQTAFTYQGVLSESGSPVTGLESIRFRIYDAETGGTLFGETTQNVDVADGLFSTPLNFGPLNLIDPTSAWIEIAVHTGGGTYETLGRQQITAAPFAMNTRGMEVSANASTITFPLGFDAELRFFEDDCCPGITGDSTVAGQPGHILRLRSDLEIHNTGTDAGSLDVRDSSGNARIKLVNEAHSDSTNRIVLNGASGQPSFFNAGNVGIGTTSPQATLHIRQASTGSTPNSNAKLIVEGTSGLATWINVLGQVNEEVGILLGNPQSSSDGALIWNDALDHLQLRAAGGTRMVVEGNGNVGIGTDNPSSLLTLQSPNTAVGKMEFMTISGGDVRFDGGTDGQFVFENSAGNSGLTRLVRTGGQPLMTVRNDGRVEFGPSSFSNVGMNIDLPYDFGLNISQGDAGKPGGGSWANTSDERLKKNIHDLEGALDILLALRGVTYEYKDPEAIGELSGIRTGFIAQEAEKVIPDWVWEAEDGYKRMTIRGFEAMAVEAFREQQEQIAALQAEIESLQNQRSMAGASMVWPVLLGGGLFGGLALARRRMIKD